MNTAVLETNLGIAPFAPIAATSPAGKVQILNADERHLEIRYCEVPDKRRLGWSLPIEYAEDLVRWWVEQGCTQAPQGGLAPHQQFGRVWVSILSESLVYVRGADAWSRPNPTGFLFPRAVLVALALTPIPQDKKDHLS